MATHRIDRLGSGWLLALCPVLVVAGHASEAAPPRLSVAMLAAAASLALSGQRVPAFVGSVAAALIAYLVVASSPVHPARLVALGVAAMAVALIQPRRRRARAASSVGSIALTLGVAGVVLWRSGWPGEARRLAALATGVAAFGLVGLTLLWLRDQTDRRPEVPRRLAVSVIAATAAFLAVADRPPRLPAWHELADALPPPAPPPHGRTRHENAGELHALEQLQAVGLQDAAQALAAVALEQNADVTSLHRRCANLGLSGALPEAWEGHVAIGQLICRATSVAPTEGAASLLDATATDVVFPKRWRAALVRLAGDLLVEAGDMDAARAVFMRADDLGDAFARRDLVRALIDDDRYVEAVQVADSADPLSGLWLGLPVEPDTAWRAWNASLDFDTLESPSRSGMTGIGDQGRIINVYDAELDRRVVWVLTQHVHTTASSLPLPPEREVPAELLLEVAVARGIRLRFLTDDFEELIYVCGTHPSHVGRRVLLFPEGSCSGSWTEVRLRPRDHLRGKLFAFEINGEYALARIAGTPASSQER